MTTCNIIIHEYLLSYLIDNWSIVCNAITSISLSFFIYTSFLYNFSVVITLKLYFTPKLWEDCIPDRNCLFVWNLANSSPNSQNLRRRNEKYGRTRVRVAPRPTRIPRALLSLPLFPPRPALGLRALPGSRVSSTPASPATSAWGRPRIKSRTSWCARNANASVCFCPSRIRCYITS